jgi:hypothetical protein
MFALIWQSPTLYVYNLLRDIPMSTRLIYTTSQGTELIYGPDASPS